MHFEKHEHEKHFSLSSHFRLTLVEIQDYLQELDDDNEIVDVAIEPPLESAEADTDCDSDKSDDEVGCDPDHIYHVEFCDHTQQFSLWSHRL